MTTLKEFKGNKWFWTMPGIGKIWLWFVNTDRLIWYRRRTWRGLNLTFSCAPTLFIVILSMSDLWSNSNASYDSYHMTNMRYDITNLCRTRTISRSPIKIKIHSSFRFNRIFVTISFLLDNTFLTAVLITLVLIWSLKVRALPLKDTRVMIIPDKDEMFLLPLTMESFSLELVEIFQFYLTLLLRISEVLMLMIPKQDHDSWFMGHHEFKDSVNC